MEVDLTKEEIEDILDNLDQCFAEGYLNAGDPALEAIIKLEQAWEKINGKTNE
jgi:hypothetical protein